MSEPTEQERWKQLQVRIKEAHDALKASKDGDLPFSYAMRVVATFGPRLDTVAFQRGEINQYPEAAILGWQRRAWNALLCAEKVLPFWTTVSPVLLQVNLSDVLDDAKRIVQSGTPPPREWGVNLIPDSDEVSYELPYPKRSLDVGRSVSAYIVVEHALGIVNRDIDNEFDLNLTYTDILGADPWEVSSAVYAARAIGGIYQVPDYLYRDDEARGEFWLWWLDEAVPASWDLKDI